MTDHKYTDEEVIRALECCSKDGMLNCRNCPYEASCNMGGSEMQRDALDLINRQRAEIAKWQLAYDCADSALRELSVTRSEAIKEFAERLKVYKQKPEFPWDEWFVTEMDIDELVKIMAGGMK